MRMHKPMTSSGTLLFIVVTIVLIKLSTNNTTGRLKQVIQNIMP